MKHPPPVIWHFLLLPLFFVWHGYNENYPFVPGSVAGLLILQYVLAAAALFAVAALLFRSHTSAALYAFLLLGMYFFFGPVHDALAAQPALKPLSAYRITLPAMALIAVVSALLLKRSRRPLRRLNQYLLLLMVVLMAWEGVISATRPRTGPATTATARTGTNTGDPDIYFVLLDSYAGNRSLQQVCHFDNSAMTDGLRAKGFFVCPDSHSNYNFTAFSMASLLNMRYLGGIRDPHACDAGDYARCAEQIKDNAVTAFLRSRGYVILNCSVFDLQGQPAPVSETFLPLKARLITDQTLLNRMKRDLLHLLVAGRYSIRWLQPDAYATLRNNDRLMALTREASRLPAAAPRFVYTHLYMPHAPYYYDSSGRLKDPAAIRADEIHRPLASYIDNLKMTNALVEQLTDTLLRNTAGRAVILLAGDHGYRGDDNGPENSAVFDNLMAIYTPAATKALHPDSLINVNLFPTLFNGLFGTQFPMHADTTVYLRDRR